MANKPICFEKILCHPIPDIHDKIFAYLDVPAKQACLQTCSALRNFILDRKEIFQAQERLHEWQNNDNYTNIQLKGFEFSKEDLLGKVKISKNNNGDIFFITLDRIIIFKNFTHAKTLDLSLSSSKYFVPENCDISWIRANKLNVCMYMNESFSIESSSNSHLEQFGEIIKIVLIEVNLDRCKIEIEKLLTFPISETAFIGILENGFSSNLLNPISYLENHTNPTYALRRLMNLSITIYKQEGPSAVLYINKKHYMTCKQTDCLHYCSIEEGLNIWSVNIPGFSSGYLNDEYAVALTRPGSIHILSAQDGSQLRTIKLHDTRHLYRRQVYCMISHNKMFIGDFRRQYFYGWLMLDLKSGKQNVYSLQCRPSISCSTDDLLLLPTVTPDEDGERKVTAYFWNEPTAEDDICTRTIKVTSSKTNPEDERVVAISQDGAILAHDGHFIEVYFIAVNRSFQCY